MDPCTLQPQPATAQPQSVPATPARPGVPSSAGAGPLCGVVLGLIPFTTCALPFGHDAREPHSSDPLPTRSEIVEALEGLIYLASGAYDQAGQPYGEGALREHHSIRVARGVAERLKRGQR